MKQQNEPLLEFLHGNAFNLNEYESIGICKPVILSYPFVSSNL